MVIYIYALAHPETGEIRYIGKSIQPEKRLREHVLSARSGKTEHHAARWLRSLIRNGLEPKLIILMTLPNGEKWGHFEQFFIASAKTMRLRLTNSTDGGDGAALTSPEAESRRNASVLTALAKPEVREKISAGVIASYDKNGRREQKRAESRAVWKNPEYIAKVAASLATTNARPDVKERRRLVAKETVNRPEVKAKLAQKTRDWLQTDHGKEHRKALLLDDSHIAKKREAAKVSWSKPEHQEKYWAAKNSPEVSTKQSNASKSQWADPEKRERIITAIRAAAARRKAEKLAQPQQA